MNRLTVSAGMTCALLFSVFGAEPDGKEWQDNQRLGLNKEEPRAAFVPFIDAQSAESVQPQMSPHQITLDGEDVWKFKWSKNPSERPVGFQNPDYDVSSWETIRVPCSWQALEANGKGGWGTALYVNVTYPFASAPLPNGTVMNDPPRHFTTFAARNPVGSYRRKFTLPNDWRESDFFLKFDGVDSFFYLWVNGEYVGFSKDSRNPAEFNVTKYLKPGENTVALEVYRYSDGSYIEDQDMFRLSGIFRSTWLVRRPKVRIRDFFATAKPVREGVFDGDWILNVKGELASSLSKAATRDVTFKLMRTKMMPRGGLMGDPLPDLQPKTVQIAIPAEGKGAFSFDVTVQKPLLWSAETPNCYTVILSIDGKTPGGETRESVSTLFGFRVSEIKNGRYYLNGQKIKLHGANRHETDPRYGHFVPHERQEEDIRLLKQANCNAVRNSHYPQDDYWYYLCDLYGIYLVDEANMESHGFCEMPHHPEWRKATVSRSLNMIGRNKNHPSVIIWSYGNESGGGPNFAAVRDAVGALDPTRPRHYQHDNGNADIDSTMYPSVNSVIAKAADSGSRKPFYLCEYAHNMVNAMGNLKDYQDAIESSDVIIGGTIWDWVDQGLYKIGSDGKRFIAFGGDFGDQPNDGQFVMNGCILSDRTLEPGYWEIKHVYQPFAVTMGADGASIEIKNKYYFRDDSAYACSWIALANGKEIGKGTFENWKPLKPQSVQRYPIPEIVKRANVPGVTASLRVIFTLKEKEGFVNKGWVVADDQIDLPAAGPVPTFKPGAGTVRMAETADRLTFTAGSVQAAFDKRSGTLVSWRDTARQTEHLVEPMTLDAFRCPSSNEVRQGDRWLAEGLRAFNAEALSFGKVEKQGDAYTFTTQVKYTGKQRERQHGYGSTKLTLETMGPTTPRNTYFIVATKWTVFGDGTIACQSEIRPHGSSCELGRIGYHFTLRNSDAIVEWLGNGPFENYADRKSGAFLGRWSQPIDRFYVPYARNEDCGNMEDTQAVAVRNAQGGIAFATLDAPFAFQANPYSATELMLHTHPTELPYGPTESKKVELGIFAATRGLGGASCGPGPIARDIIKSNRPYPLSFVIRPYRDGAMTPCSLPTATLPPDPVEENRDTYKVLSVSSIERSESRPDYLVDDDIGTFWHSKWSGSNVPRHPHTVTIDTLKMRKIKGISILPRQDGNNNGRVKDFLLETSKDGKSWTEALRGTLRDTHNEQTVKCDTPIEGRYIRFTSLNAHRNQPWACIAELRVIE